MTESNLPNPSRLSDQGTVKDLSSYKSIRRSFDGADELFNHVIENRPETLGYIVRLEVPDEMILRLPEIIRINKILLRAGVYTDNEDRIVSALERDSYRLFELDDNIAEYYSLYIKDIMERRQESIASPLSYEKYRAERIEYALYYLQHDLLLRWAWLSGDFIPALAVAEAEPDELDEYYSKFSGIDMVPLIIRQTGKGAVGEFVRFSNLELINPSIIAREIDLLSSDGFDTEEDIDCQEFLSDNTKAQLLRRCGAEQLVEFYSSLNSGRGWFVNCQGSFGK